MTQAPIRTPSPLNTNRRAALQRLVLGAGGLAAATVLSACGFKLRGFFTFAFDTLQVTGLVGSPVSKALQDNLGRLGVAAGSAAPAVGKAGAVVLNVVVDQRERSVVGQSTNGQVRELVLRQRFRYSLSTLTGRRLLEESELVLERNITFSESAALSKAGEEQLMFEDMQSDAMQQVLRRLSAVKSV